MSGKKKATVKELTMPVKCVRAPPLRHLAHGDASLVHRQDGFVQIPLGRGESSRDREGPGDVGAVRVELAPRVDEDQLEAKKEK